MGVRFTEEQQRVIDSRDCNLLVAAAAGSGKTAVLVERIISMLTSKTDPVSVDELLVVTFTEMAAREMKDRIRNAIELALSEDPQNEHLQRQTSLIHNAQVTTIDSFCVSVIKEYFHVIDLDPCYRVGENGEMDLLKHDVLGEVLESFYAEGSEEFLDFVECYVSGKDDRKLEELILKLYTYGQSYPQPEKWLADCVARYTFAPDESLDEKDFIREMLHYSVAIFEDARRENARLTELAKEPGGPYMYEEALLSDGELLEALCRQDSYSNMHKALKSREWVKLKSCTDNDVDPALADKVRSGRNDIKDAVNKIATTYFAKTPQELCRYMQMARPNMEVLARLVGAFMEAFAEAKRTKNLIDFNDMEHFALAILTEEKDGKLVPSQIAKNYQNRYREVMIDEYQDSNYVQEALLTSVSKQSQGIHNIFMVGDVKQSIYRFRLARPELFMEKYNTYQPQSDTLRRIDLYKNFRSRHEVLESTNYIFRQIMIPEFGGIAYDDLAALYPGAAYPEMSGNETELLLLEKEEYLTEESRQAEAMAVANRIKDLIEHHRIVDKKTGELRNVRYNDIVILMRSLKDWTEPFASVLAEQKIPTYTSSKAGYFETIEIQMILDYLRVIDNPRQDIPLVATLTGSWNDISSTELAQIKCEGEEGDFYDHICRYAKEGTDERLRRKLDDFLERLSRCREKMTYLTIYELLCYIVETEGYADYISAMPGGVQRVANLQMLLKKAMDFEKTSYKGLFHFVRYIDQLQKYEVDYGEANIANEQNQVVRLMSIHKSKGLEFPIVFVVGMGKQFNTNASRQNIVLHPDYGVGLDAIDYERRSIGETALKTMMKRRIVMDDAAEELRVLYVAMTRAKEKLILVGCLNHIEKALEKCERYKYHQEESLGYVRLTEAGSYLDWILPAIYRNCCADELLQSYGMEVPFTNGMYQKKCCIRVRRIQAEDLAKQEVLEQIEDHCTRQEFDAFDTETIYDEKARAQIDEQLSYTYPHTPSIGLCQTLSVSELKKRAYEEQEGSVLYPEEVVVPYLPKFLKGKETYTGAMRGTAYHRVMELLDFTAHYQMEEIQAALQLMEEQGLLDPEMRIAVSAQDILDFMAHPIAGRMHQAAKTDRLYAEQPFVIGVQAQSVEQGSSPDEMILVEGIIDVWFEEEDGLVILDYKTDKVRSGKELTDRYRVQLLYYAQALARLTGKRVKEAYLYSFTLKEEIPVSIDEKEDILI